MSNRGSASRNTMNNSNGNSNTSGIISDNVVSNGGGRNTNATAATIEFSDIFNDEIERGSGFVSGTTAASNSNTTIIANNNINNNSTIVHNMLNSSTANDNNSALSNNVNQLHQWVDPILAASPYNFFLADPPSTTTTTTSADNNNTAGAVLRQQQQTIICQPQMQQIQQIQQQQQQQQPQFHQQFPTWQDMTSVNNNNNNNMNVGNTNATAMLPQQQPQSQPQSTTAGIPSMIQAQQAHQQLSQNNNKNSNSMAPPSIKIKQEPKKTTTLPSATSSAVNNMNKRKNPSEISEDELSIKQRRKHERNIREQQRSHRITAQIVELRRVLSETAQVHFQKTDKHSILFKAVEYIRHLQARCVSLDDEHSRIVKTICETSDLVNRNAAPSNSSSSSTYIPEASKNIFESSCGGVDSMDFFDYKSIFQQCPVPVAVADLDGRFLDSNEAFESVIGYVKEEMIQRNMSLFHLIEYAKDLADICKVMGNMIRESEEKQQMQQQTNNQAQNNNNNSQSQVQTQNVVQQYWSGIVRSPKATNVNQYMMNVTMTRSQEGNPRFFNCALYAT